ncbi:unnamed protein product [Rhizoctonia solani]|uniref:Plasmid pRiA4b Orf3-like domain-containing protein n=3 Tax=Rhizoctonia solani TaxID=456999 RepID=A0A8H2WMJ6_9AGAM|nr:plasmid pRiA4b ORF-like protein [Rhizoctonia solani AG-3 Rhs1AP]KEP48276.1 plasmid pRiA4b ORF-like protein [Rhizoctonia solani 123E]CAE6395467.1 unnamed protein product [Rhizoctonia solani]CAE6503055.1 unnamed protein product [Rhizoctonia solani]
MPSKRTFAELMTPDGTPESSYSHTGSTPPIILTSPSAPTPKRQCHDARAVNAKPGHSPDNLFGTVPKKPVIELPRPARTSAEVRVQLVGQQAFRRVHIPSNYTFIHLHHLMLFLFGWSGVHAHRFSVQNNIVMHELKRGHVRSGNLFIDVSPPRPPPSKREVREAKRLARALAKSNMRDNPSDDSDTDWEGPGSWRPLVLDQKSVRQRSEEALTIGEVFGAHVCRRGRAIIYEYDPNHSKGFKVHITLIDLVQHDEPDQPSSPPAWPALPPLPPSSPIRSIASSPYTPRGRQFSLDLDSSPARSLSRSRSMTSMTLDDGDEDVPQRPSLGADRTNNPWVVVGLGVSPPERELAITQEEGGLEEHCEPRVNASYQGKTRKEGGLSLRIKCIELDADLFNDGPDGEEGTCFGRWLSGELVVEREGNTLLVRDRARALARTKESKRAKSTGWDSDEESPDDQEVEPATQGPVSLEPLGLQSDQEDELEDETEPEDPAIDPHVDEAEEEVDYRAQDEQFWDDD